MEMISRRAAASLTFAGLLGRLIRPALAQGFPNQPVRMIAPFAPGGPADVISRIIGRVMGEKLRQPMVVESRGGAGGILGVEATIRAPADGHTLLLGSVGPIVLQPLQLPQPPYDPVRDLAPISMVCAVQQVLVASRSLPVQDLAGLIAYAKANPGKLSYGSASTGGSTHLAGELFKLEAGIDIEHVPYRGIAPALVDLMGGQTNLLVGDLQAVLPAYRRDEVRIMGVMASRRSAAIPDVPSMAEAGLPNVVSGNWYALFAPMGVPADRLAILRTALLDAVGDPATAAALTDFGAEVAGSTSEELGRFVRDEQVKWRRIIRFLADRQAR